MIRVHLGARGLGGVRFALSPLDAASDLLFALGGRELRPPWAARTATAVAEQKLGLLALVAGGGPKGYAPDFLRPEPAGWQMSLGEGLHQVVTASRERVGFELSAAVQGHAWDPGSHRTAPRLLLQAISRGEDYMARRLANELAQFWQVVVAPHWPAVRARLEADIAASATTIAHHGLAATLNQLAPNMRWHDGSLDIGTRSRSSDVLTVSAEAAVLTPSVFTDRAIFCGAEPAGAPSPRTPLIVYPVAPTDALAGRPTLRLIGDTRVRLLAELAEPRATTELAQRLYLSPATVSYHLQILYRAGLVSRTRRSRTVFYQRLAAPSLP